jgi:parallel beta-helix repeat protein
MDAIGGNAAQGNRSWYSQSLYEKEGQQKRSPITNYLLPVTQLVPFLFAVSGLLLPDRVLASTVPLRVVVNSNQDSPVQADDALTLREAIEVVNGTLPPERLSLVERSQVSPLQPTDSSRIEFNLPPTATTIRLTEVLPPLSVPLVVDGTTQPGYNPAAIGTKQIETPGAGEQVSRGAGENIQSTSPLPLCSSAQLPLAVSPSLPPFLRPVVAVTPAPGREVFRGFSVAADRVTIRGLSVYGFTSRHRATATTPPADIFISHRLPPPDTSRQQPPAGSFAYRRRDVPPKDVVIENNWLGIPPVGEYSQDGRRLRVFARERPLEIAPETPEPPQTPITDSFFRPLVSFFGRYLTAKPAKLPTTSAFGVYVFNSLGTTIRRNIIANHDASAIITAVAANNLLIEGNILECNGFAGMPDAIRLEGVISNTEIVGNVIRDNAGSGIYLFKPQGSAKIQGNAIASNGRRYRRAAIYLMGEDHQVVDNRISDQPGPGVVVAAFPNSDRNLIRGNQFSRLRGLSIDLVTQINTDVHAYQIGDGPNPRMESHQQRRKTGNFGIEAPRFVSREFFPAISDGGVTLAGRATPGAVVEIYRVSEDSNTRGPLSMVLATTETDAEGLFSMRIADLQPGERVSAIATHPEYGTSEPAINAVIRSIPSSR